MNRFRTRAPGLLLGALIIGFGAAGLGALLAHGRDDVFHYIVALAAVAFTTWWVMAFLRRRRVGDVPAVYPIGHLYRIDETDPGLHQLVPDGEWFGTRFVHAETCPVPGCVDVALSRSQTPGSTL
jgi:cytochrome c biogenesis protein CcdA